MKQNHKRMTLTVLWCDDCDDAVRGYCDCELEIPAKYEVCGRCGGRGVHDHPAFEDGFNGSEEWCDQDFLEEYQAGVYDVPCSECGGRNVVLVPDEKRLTPQMREALEAEYQFQAEAAAERRMRAQGIQF